MIVSTYIVDMSILRVDHKQQHQPAVHSHVRDPVQRVRRTNHVEQDGSHHRTNREVGEHEEVSEQLDLHHYARVAEDEGVREQVSRVPDLVDGVLVVVDSAVDSHEEHHVLNAHVLLQSSQLALGPQSDAQAAGK